MTEAEQTKKAERAEKRKRNRDNKPRKRLKEQLWNYAKRMGRNGKEFKLDPKHLGEKWGYWSSYVGNRINALIAEGKITLVKPGKSWEGCGKYKLSEPVNAEKIGKEITADDLWDPADDPALNINKNKYKQSQEFYLDCYGQSYRLVEPVGD